jgi:mannose-6-phosphate isomerase-like protein (cupin superfamily)
MGIIIPPQVKHKTQNTRKVERICLVGIDAQHNNELRIQRMTTDEQRIRFFLN